VEKLVLTEILGLASIKQSTHELGRMVATWHFLELVGTGFLDDTEVSLDTDCVCLSGHVSSNPSWHHG